MHAPSGSISVLHVDDDPDLRDLAATVLEREEERLCVETAPDAAAGLERLEGTDVDCIVSDFDMPGRNGIEFLEAVRKEYPELPFILFTGKGSEQVAAEAISSGVTDYLQKESGTSQYAVLANRIRNAVANYHAQARLADRERRLNLFFEQSPLGVIEWDDTFDLARMNAAAEEILGHTQADLVGESWEAIVPESDREDVGDVVDALLENKGGFHSVNENVRKDGERIVCEWHNRVVTDGADEVVAVFSQFQDVTERRERERQLETLVDNLPGMIYRCRNEPGWPMDDVRGEVEALTGYRPADLEGADGRYGTEVIHPDDRDRVWSRVQEALDGEGAFELTYRITTADGSTKWVWERGRRIRTDDGTDDAMEGFITDVTERERSRQALAEEREFIDQALDTLDDVFYVLGPDGEMRRWNSRVETVTGYGEEEIESMNVREFFPEAERERIADAVDETLETGSATVESEILTTDGERIPYEFTGDRLRDCDGDVTGLVGVGRRLSARKRDRGSNDG
jgi:PAS domain S-box-containing protein